MARVPWKVGVLLALLPLAFTAKAFLRGDLYGPSDLYYGHDPWRGVAAENGIRGVANPILSDLAFANIPWRAAVRESLVNGRLPLWNRFVLAGSPLLATAQASVFHPATWLGIFLPLAQSWTFSCAFTIFLALLAGYLFFREVCASDAAALVGAVGWGFSTYVLFWDGWAVGPSISTFPLLILGLRRLALAPAGGRGVGITTAALALSFHGGHPETFFHCLAAGGVYFLWEVFPRDRRRRARSALAGVLAAGMLALGLAAPVLLPLLEALPHSAEYAARRAALAEGRPRQSVPAGEAARRLRPAILPFAHGIYGRSPVQERRQDGSGMPLGYAGAVLFPLAAVGAFGGGGPGSAASSSGSSSPASRTARARRSCSTRRRACPASPWRSTTGSSFSPRSGSRGSRPSAPTDSSSAGRQPGSWRSPRPVLSPSSRSSSSSRAAYSASAGSRPISYASPSPRRRAAAPPARRRGGARQGSAAALASSGRP